MGGKIRVHEGEDFVDKVDGLCDHYSTCLIFVLKNELVDGVNIGEILLFCLLI